MATASQRTIERLQQNLADEKRERAVDNQRHQQELKLEQTFRTSQWNELLYTYPALRPFVQTLLHIKLAADPLRGAPHADTMRVGHPELTSTEAAANVSHPRRRVERANGKIERLAGQLDDELRESDDKRPPAPPKPRCRRRACVEGYDKVQPYGVKVCGFCGEPISAAA